jgi:hypothetical protein
MHDVFLTLRVKINFGHELFLVSEIYGWCNSKAGFNPNCAILNCGKMACAGTWEHYYYAIYVMRL